VAERVTLTQEDAHIFDTSVLENLRVARGTVTPQEATALLQRAGLGTWLATLPEGLDTVVGTDATALSGGERRRLWIVTAASTRSERRPCASLRRSLRCGWGRCLYGGARCPLRGGWHE